MCIVLVVPYKGFSTARHSWWTNYTYTIYTS